MFEALLPIDAAVFDWVRPIASDALNTFFKFITALGDGGWFWIVIALLLLIPNKTRKVGCVMALALVFDVVINNGILKNLFDRPRPFDLDINWWIEKYVWPNLVAKPTSPSFPSGHTAISFAGAAGLLFGSLRYKKTAAMQIAAAVAMVLAALIGFSRIYVGVHYFTDVLAGLLIGVACAALASLSFKLIVPVFEKVNAPLENFIKKHMPKILH